MWGWHLGWWSLHVWRALILPLCDVAPLVSCLLSVMTLLSFSFHATSAPKSLHFNSRLLPTYAPRNSFLIVSYNACCQSFSIFFFLLNKKNFIENQNNGKREIDYTTNPRTLQRGRQKCIHHGMLPMLNSISKPLTNSIIITLIYYHLYMLLALAIKS